MDFRVSKSDVEKRLKEVYGNYAVMYTFYNINIITDEINDSLCNFGIKNLKDFNRNEEIIRACADSYFNEDNC